MKRRTGATSFAFRDVLYLIAFGYLFTLAMVLASISPKASDAASIHSPGNMSVTIVWADGPYDADLWVRAPGEEKAVGYSNRGGKVFNLLRDDLGERGDGGMFNREDAFSRGLPAGEYVINIHGYSVMKEIPVVLEVRIAAGEGMAQLVVREQTTIRQGQERTVVRFRLDGNGRVVVGSMNKVYVPLRSAGK